MKNLRTFCAAFVLMLALTTPAFAGTMSTPAAPPPAPQGTIHTMITNQESTDSVTNIALNLLLFAFSQGHL